MLEDKIHTTVLEVNLDHMIHNLNYFRSLLHENVQMMAMVKAAGYGTGTFEVANMLEQQGVSFLAVAFADEGVTLREAGITMPIVVLNADSDSFELMLDYRLEPEIYNRLSLLSFEENNELLYMPVPVSAIRQPTRELGETAVRMLINLIRGLAVPEHEVLNCSLVSRSSVAKRNE